MTPKEKAKELIEKVAMQIDGSYRSDLPKRITIHNAGKCALIVVEEMLKVTLAYNDTQAEYTYWQQIKQEIKNYKP